MAAFYANENFPLAVVKTLRALGHDVLTSLDAGRANQRIPDEQVLQFAAQEGRVLLTMNRRDFLRLHNSGQIPHAGLVLCTTDADFVALAQRIHEAISGARLTSSFLLRINKPDISEKTTQA